MFSKEKLTDIKNQLSLELKKISGYAKQDILNFEDVIVQLKHEALPPDQR